MLVFMWPRLSLKRNICSVVELFFLFLESVKALFIWSWVPETALLPGTTLPSVYMRIA